MKNVLIALSLILIFQTTALANNWIKILEDKNLIYSIKYESIRYEGGLMYLWTQVTKKDSSSREKLYLAVNCDNRSFKSMNDEYDYSDDDFDNQNHGLAQSLDSKNQFTRVPAGTPAEKVYRYVCK